MKNLDLDNKVLTIGTTQFNKAALGKFTKEEFLKVYTPILKTDMKEVWKKVSKYTKVEKVSKPKKDK